MDRTSDFGSASRRRSAGFAARDSGAGPVHVEQTVHEMVIDTSALLAIFANEPERRRYIEAIEAADVRLVSAGTFVETSIVLEARYGVEGSRLFDLFRDRAVLDIVDVDEQQAFEARRAYSRFGKGRHPAGLNFGDCFAYALAITSGERLLFKGADFPQTDLDPVF